MINYIKKFKILIQKYILLYLNPMNIQNFTCDFLRF